MRVQKVARAILVLVVGSALLAACGSTGSAASTTPSDTSAGAASQSTDSGDAQSSAQESSASGSSESTGDASPGPAVTIRVAGNTNATVLPLWVGMEQGIFQRNGLDVTYTKVGDISTLVPALGKSFDVVLTTPVNIITAGSQGIPVQWVAGSSINEGDETSNTRLIVGKDSKITDVSQLKGKTIGTVALSGTAHIATLYWLKKAGVPLDSIKVIQIAANQQADQLAAGRVDAVEAVHPFAEQIIDNGGHSLGSPYAQLAPNLAGIVWAAQPDWAKANSTAVEEFQKSLGEAQQYIKDNNAAARKLLAEKTGLPAKVADSTILPLFDSAVKESDLEVWEDAMKEATGFSAKPDLSKLVFTK